MQTVEVADLVSALEAGGCTKKCGLMRAGIMARHAAQRIACRWLQARGFDCRAASCRAPQGGEAVQLYAQQTVLQAVARQQKV